MWRISTRSFFRPLVLMALVALSLGAFLRFRTSQAANASRASGPATLALQDRAMVHAARRGNPWINFQDGRQPQVVYQGEATGVASVDAKSADPRALAAADFDGDGFADLVVGYA